jgi:hypothetical protein
MVKITVYSKKLNPRIDYALKIVFRVILGIDYYIESNKENFLQSGDIKINYSDESFDSCLQVIPHGLLHENDIHSQKTILSSWNELPVFFQTGSAIVPFDLFAAVFYLVTRYEEYLYFEPDKHGRFEADQSLAYRGQFLHLPIVDLWSIEIAKLLGIENICPNIQTNNYSFRLTIDIDQPWRYRNKGLFYMLGKLAKSILTLHISDFFSHINALIKPQSDSGNSYEYLSGIEKRLDHSIRYFILCCKYDTLDRNLSMGRQAFLRLLNNLDSKRNLGIHPSISSSSKLDVLKSEINYLSDVLHRKIEFSRQHYLFLSFPDTYRNLIGSGISGDYTMGFASQCGFRAGIARSFNFFDLLENKETSLRVFPFEVMDRTLLSYKKMSPQEAMKEFEYYTNIVRSVGGELICLWHNDSLHDKDEWQGWKKVFEKMIEYNEYI